MILKKETGLSVKPLTENSLEWFGKVVRSISPHHDVSEVTLTREENISA